MVARHVSDLNGPSSGAFTSCKLQIWYVVIYVNHHIPNLQHTACKCSWRWTNKVRNMSSHQVLWINSIIKHCVSGWFTHTHTHTHTHTYIYIARWYTVHTISRPPYLWYTQIIYTWHITGVREKELFYQLLTLFTKQHFQNSPVCRVGNT